MANERQTPEDALAERQAADVAAQNMRGQPLYHEATVGDWTFTAIRHMPVLDVTQPFNMDDIEARSTALDLSHPETAEKLRALVKVLEETEARTGQKFDRDVTISGEYNYAIHPGMGKDGTGTLRIGSHGWMTGNMDFTESFLLHELGHQKTGNASALMKMKLHTDMPDFLDMVAQLVEQDPVRAQAWLYEQFGSMEYAKNYLGRVERMASKLRDAAEPLIGISDQEAAALLKQQPALLQERTAALNVDEVLKVSMGDLTPKGFAEMLLDGKLQNPATREVWKEKFKNEPDALAWLEHDEPLRELRPAPPNDNVFNDIRQLVAGWKDSHQPIANSVFTGYRAEEYLADEFALRHTHDKEAYYRALKDIEHIEKEGRMAAADQEDVLGVRMQTHPEIDERIARGRAVTQPLPRTYAEVDAWLKADQQQRGLLYREAPLPPEKITPAQMASAGALDRAIRARLELEKQPLIRMLGDGPITSRTLQIINADRLTAEQLSFIKQRTNGDLVMKGTTAEIAMQHLTQKNLGDLVAYAQTEPGLHWNEFRAPVAPTPYYTQQQQMKMEKIVVPSSPEPAPQARAMPMTLDEQLGRTRIISRPEIFVRHTGGVAGWPILHNLQANSMLEDAATYYRPEAIETVMTRLGLADLAPYVAGVHARTDGFRAGLQFDIKENHPNHVQADIRIYMSVERLGDLPYMDQARAEARQAHLAQKRDLDLMTAYTREEQGRAHCTEGSTNDFRTVAEVRATHAIEDFWSAVGEDEGLPKVRADVRRVEDGWLKKTPGQRVPPALQARREAERTAAALPTEQVNDAVVTNGETIGKSMLAAGVRNNHTQNTGSNFLSLPLAIYGLQAQLNDPSFARDLQNGGVRSTLAGVGIGSDIANLAGGTLSGIDSARTLATGVAAESGFLRSASQIGMRAAIPLGLVSGGTRMLRSIGEGDRAGAAGAMGGTISGIGVGLAGGATGGAVAGPWGAVVLGLGGGLYGGIVGEEKAREHLAKTMGAITGIDGKLEDALQGLDPRLKPYLGAWTQGEKPSVEMLHTMMQHAGSDSLAAMETHKDNNLTPHELNERVKWLVIGSRLSAQLDALNAMSAGNLIGKPGKILTLDDVVGAFPKGYDFLSIDGGKFFPENILEAMKPENRLASIKGQVENIVAACPTGPMHVVQSPELNRLREYKTAYMKLEPSTPQAHALYVNMLQAGVDYLGKGGTQDEALFNWYPQQRVIKSETLAELRSMNLPGITKDSTVDDVSRILLQGKVAFDKVDSNHNRWLETPEIVDAVLHPERFRSKGENSR